MANTGFGNEAFYHSLSTGCVDVATTARWEEDDVDSTFFYPFPEVNFKECFTKLSPPFPLRYSKMAMFGCFVAMRDARVMSGEIPDHRIGLLLNTCFGANAAVEDYLEKLYTKGPSRVSPFGFTKTVPNAALGDVSRYFKLRGVSSLLMDENCVGYGFDLIRDHQADVVVCGGFDEIRDIVQLFYGKKGKLFKLPEGMEGLAGDFLQKALIDGKDKGKTIFGEASAFIVLEEYEHAVERKARIYTEIINYATVSDSAYNGLIFERSSLDCGAAMEYCLSKTDTLPRDIDLVVGSSGLPWQFHHYEKEALKDIWKDTCLHYTSIKSYVGETFGSSGQISLIAGLLMMQNGKVFGSKWPVLNVPRQLIVPESTIKDVSISQVLVNSVHSGSNNTSILMKSMS